MSRKLGQHFLINQSAIAKIIAALDLSLGDTVIEIGPGKGALTLPLAKTCAKIGCKLVAIEKDSALVKNLKVGAEIITGDALRILPKLEFSKIVGNIPYYITGKLLRILSELKNKPKLTVMTIQREVAERICAHPPKMNPTHRKCPMCGMNLLAAAVQIWAEPIIIGNLRAKDFNPPPKVDSAIIKLVTKPNTPNPIPYYRLIKAVFKQPRKTVLNNLSTSLNVSKEEVAKMLRKVGLTGAERPQNLSLEALIKLSTIK